MTMGLGMRLLLSPARPACLSERDTERFEDCLEDVVRVGPVDQPHMESQRRTVDELAQKRGDDAGRHAPEPLAGKVDIGDKQRSPRTLLPLGLQSRNWNGLLHQAIPPSGPSLVRTPWSLWIHW
jgi:hypothetical protein